MEKNDIYLASQSSTITGVEVFNKQLSFIDTLYPYDSNLPIPPTSEESHPSGSRVVYWYNLYDKEFLYNSSTDVYAYKFHVICSDVSLSQKGLQTLNFVFGSDNNFSTLESFNVGLSIMQAGECNYWYVNDYVNTPIYFGALALFGDNPSTASNINYSAKFKIDVVSYSMDDMLDEIYEQLLDLVAGQDELYNELVKIYDTSASIDTKLTTIRGQLESIKTAMPVLHTDLMNIEKALNSIQSTLDDMLEEDKKQTSWLENIWNSLQDLFSGDYGGSPVPDNSDGSAGFDTEIPGSGSPGSGSDSSSGTQDKEKVGFFDMVANFFSNFFGNLMNAFKGLFVPDEDYLSNFFTRLNVFFSEKLGFLYVPIDLLIQFLTALMNASPGTASLPLPEFKWEGVTVLSGQDISLDLSKDFPQLQTMLHFATNVLLIGSVLNLLQNKLKEMLQ